MFDIEEMLLSCGALCVCVCECEGAHGAQNSSVSQLRTFTTGNKKAWRLTYFLAAAGSSAPYCKCQSISAAAIPEMHAAREVLLHFRRRSREQKEHNGTSAGPSMQNEIPFHLLAPLQPSRGRRRQANFIAVCCVIQ